MEYVKDQVKEDYLNGMKYKDLEKKYKTSINTIKSWIKRYGWSEEKRNRGAPKNIGGAPLKNKNAVGHGAPKKNKNAEKFGFFSKYLPEDTLEIMKDLEEKSPLDMLWEQITIQYAAIIRAQKIMYVENKDEIIKVLKKEESTDFGDKREWEYQFAWDRQASFLNAQSRAMSELRGLIKQYDGMLNNNLELATEEQKLRIEKLKGEVSNLNKDNLEDKELKIIVDYGEKNGDS